MDGILIIVKMILGRKILKNFKEFRGNILLGINRIGSAHLHLSRDPGDLIMVCLLVYQEYLPLIKAC